MRGLFLRPSAKADLRQIARHSREKWGNIHALNYMTSLTASLSHLTDMPDLGVERSDLGAGYRCVSVGAHLLFYRVETDRIDVIRILHRRMDAGRHLP